MSRSVPTCPAILVLTGASGAGKTTLALELNGVAIPGVEGFNCDRVNVKVLQSADPSDRQAAVLDYWITHLRNSKARIELAVLDTQIRPHRAREVLDRAGVVHSQIVLIDCDPTIRNERLRTQRSQPELANPQMDCWAAYLRGQADALNLEIIDTSTGSIKESLTALTTLVKKLLNQAKV